MVRLVNRTNQITPPLCSLHVHRTGLEMALAGITTLLATSGGPNADRSGTANLGQILRLTSTDEMVQFDEELQSILLPFANAANPAALPLPTVDTVTTEPIADVEMFEAYGMLEPDNQPDGSHFIFAFASAMPPNLEQVPALPEQAVNALPVAPTDVTEPSVPVTQKVMAPPPLAGPTDVLPDADVDSPLPESEQAIVLQPPETSDGKKGKLADQNSPAEPKPANKVSDSPFQPDATPRETFTSPVELATEDVLEAVDSPDHSETRITSHNADVAASSTPNSMVMPTHSSSTNADASSADVSEVDAPNLAEQIATEAVRHADVVKHQGQQRFTMRLDPPELGKLVVEMQRTEKGLTMRVNAADPVTLGLIQSSLDELNTSLGQQDSVFQEVNIDVTTGGAFQESLNDRSSQQSQRKGREAAPDSTPTPSAVSHDQNVDFVA